MAQFVYSHSRFVSVLIAKGDYYRQANMTKRGEGAESNEEMMVWMWWSEQTGAEASGTGN